jgi:hypothetical protein
MRILFLGNSHTYYNDMTGMFESMVCAAEGSRPEVVCSTGDGVGLRWHWNHRRSREHLAEGRWDWIILQERSGGPLEDPEQMDQYARRLRGAAEGSNVCLYMTWPLQNQPDTGPIIFEIYERIAQSLGAAVAPVGRVWSRLQQDTRGLNLYDSDGRHASIAGSYAAAVTIASTVTSRQARAGGGCDGLTEIEAAAIQVAVNAELRNR